MGRFDIITKKNEIVQKNRYQSSFEFEKYDISDEEMKNRISKIEEETLETGKQIAKKNLELGKKFYEMQKLLANSKTGTFLAWINYMNIDKNFVYRAIDRWKIFLKHRNPRLAEASIKTIEFIKQNDETLDENKINEILEEPKLASKKIKEIKEMEAEEVKEISVEEKIAEINKKINHEYQKIEKSEEKIKKLEEKKQKLILGE